MVAIQWTDVSDNPDDEKFRDELWWTISEHETEFDALTTLISMVNGKESDAASYVYRAVNTDPEEAF